MDAERIERTSESPEETAAIGAAIAGSLSGGECLALEGEFGAGKTTLVRALAEALGVDPEQVSSPTFVILQRHRGERLDLVHADAHRVRSALELEGTGWQELVGSPGTVAAIEWASRVPDALPADAIRIELAHDFDGTPSRRRVSIRDPDPSRAARLRQAIDAALRPAPCPICGTPVERAAPDSPFCSPRCRSADLGRWFRGNYRVSRSLAPDDLEER
ncbi:MAG: tRNA (adenosine(37)-N6)-threonylcarbamoyltransferase complex ATPase subunit type 1 TsaE [Phycisphaerae bacterium]|nr:tRNA (adenosine(37)-N6)-threonylcarbamoyltransferase complex ATPase subunit type 1 TsaE [Phycisphaerae bacterium]